MKFASCYSCVMVTRTRPQRPCCQIHSSRLRVKRTRGPRLKSSERRMRTSSAGAEWILGGLRQAFLVAGEAVEAGLRGAVAEGQQEGALAGDLDQVAMVDQVAMEQQMGATKQTGTGMVRYQLPLLHQRAGATAAPSSSHHQQQQLMAGAAAVQRHLRLQPTMAGVPPANQQQQQKAQLPRLLLAMAGAQVLPSLLGVMVGEHRLLLAKQVRDGVLLRQQAPPPRQMRLVQGLQQQHRRQTVGAAAQQHLQQQVRAGEQQHLQEQEQRLPRPRRVCLLQQRSRPSSSSSSRQLR